MQTFQNKLHLASILGYHLDANQVWRLPAKLPSPPLDIVLIRFLRFLSIILTILSDMEGCSPCLLSFLFLHKEWIVFCKTYLSRNRFVLSKSFSASSFIISTSFVVNLCCSCPPTSASQMLLHLYAFVTWLVVKNRVATGDRMMKWKHNVNTSCVFCNDPVETRDHLFFECLHFYFTFTYFLIRYREQ